MRLVILLNCLGLQFIHWFDEWPLIVLNFLTAYNNGGATPNMPDARKPLQIKAFRASLTLVPAGYVGTRNAALRGDLPLRQRVSPTESVAQNQDRPLPRRQRPRHRVVELPVHLLRAQVFEQILVCADHIHQRQRICVLPRLDALRQRHVPRRLLLRPEIHQNLIFYTPGRIGCEPCALRRVERRNALDETDRPDRQQILLIRRL